MKPPRPYRTRSRLGTPEFLDHGFRDHCLAKIGARFFMPCARPAGRTKSARGRDRARASRSLFPESEAAHPMNVISGPSGFLSSASRSLSQSLANRLRPMTDSLGSTLFRLGTI